MYRCTYEMIHSIPIRFALYTWNVAKKSETINKPSPIHGFIVGLNRLCLFHENDAALESASVCLPPWT